MDMLSKHISSEVEHTTSSLYSYIVLWAAKLHLPLKNDNPKQHRNGYCHGLQTLVHSEEEKLPQTSRILHCYNMAPTPKPKPFCSPPPPKSLWSPSSPALRSTVMGDVIGAESGDCMSGDVAVAEEQVEETVKDKAEPERQSRGRERSGTRREFPPPITLLRQTGEMPWCFKREYSEDGRLIIRAERSVEKRREYVEARRENGRLIMRLVPEEDHDDDDDDDDDDDSGVCCEECGWPMDEEEEEELEDFEFNGLECVGDDDEEEEDEGEDFEQELAKEGCNLSQISSLESEGGRCGDLRQCASCAGGLVRDSDSFWTADANCFLGRPGSAPLQPMTPVM